MKRALLVALLLAGCAFLISLVYNPIPMLQQEEEVKEGEIPTVELAGEVVYVSVVDTDEKRRRGLGGRASLAPNEGMLFVFPEDGTYSIWMKDMRFAIDIVWISSSGEIVDLRESVAPETYPAIFTPRSEARYVLELPQGWVSGHGVEVGDAMKL